MYPEGFSNIAIHVGYTNLKDKLLALEDIPVVEEFINGLPPKEVLTSP